MDQSLYSTTYRRIYTLINQLYPKVEEEDHQMEEENSTSKDSKSSRRLSKTILASKKDNIPKNLKLDKTPLIEDERVERKKYSNGFESIIISNQMPPDRFFVYLDVLAGSVDERDFEQGMAHVLEHCVFLGTEKYPTARELEAQYQSWGLAFGADSNASTGFRTTTYTLAVPIDNEGKNLENAIDLLHQLVRKPLLKASALPAELKVVLAELDTRNTIGFRKEKHLHELVHHNIPDLRDRMPSGLKEQVAGFTAEQLKDFWSRHYHPKFMKLYVVGNIEAKKTQSIIDRLWKDEKNGTTAVERKSLSRPLIAPKVAGQIEVYQRDLFNNFSLTFYWLLPPEKLRVRKDTTVDFLDSMLAQILSYRLGSLRSSSDPGFRAIGWSYSNSWDEACSIASFDVYSEPKDWKRAVRIAFNEVARLVKFEVSESEIAQARESFLNMYRSSYLSRETEQSEDVLGAVMEADADGSVFTRIDLDLALAESYLPTITPKMILDTARLRFTFLTKFFEKDAPYPFAFLSIPTKAAMSATTENSSSSSARSNNSKKKVAATAPSKAPTSSSSARSKASTSSTSSSSSSRSKVHKVPFSVDIVELKTIIQHALKSVENRQEVEVPIDLITSAAMDKKVKDRSPSWVPESLLTAPDPTSKIYRRRLSNGIYVNYKQTEYEKGFVSAIISGWGGKFLTKNLVEIGQLKVGLDMFCQSGLNGHSWTAVSRWLSVNNMAIDGGQGSSGIEFTLDCPSIMMEKGFQALHLYLDDTNRPDKAEAFTRSRNEHKKNKIDSLSSLSASCSVLMAELQTANRDHRYLSLPAEVYDQLKPQKCYDSITSHLRKDALELSVVGDFDLETIEPLILRYFGSLALSESYPDGTFTSPERRKISYPTKPVRELVHVFDKDKPDRAWIRMKWKAPDRATGYPTRLRLLDIASEVLSNRLIQIIRNEKGLVYSISFSYGASTLYDGGWAATGMFATVDKVDACIDTTLKVLDDFLANGFTQKEYDEAVKPSIASMITDLTDNSYWLAMMDGLQWPHTLKSLETVNSILSFYKSAKKEDVEACFKKWISFKNPIIAISQSNKEVVKDSVGGLSNRRSSSSNKLGPKIPASPDPKL